MARIKESRKYGSMLGRGGPFVIWEPRGFWEFGAGEPVGTLVHRVHQCHRWGVWAGGEGRGLWGRLRYHGDLRAAVPTPASLTQQDEDTDEDGHDGARAQPGCRHGADSSAVTVLVTWAHLDLDEGHVGQWGVPGVGDDDGDLVYSSLQEQEAQAQLGVVTWADSEHTLAACIAAGAESCVRASHGVAGKLSRATKLA